MNEHNDEPYRLNDIPVDELKVLAAQLMTPIEGSAEQAECVGAIERRLKLIDRLDRQALLDIVIWARRPVARSADKLELVREISQITFNHYDGLSTAAMTALVQLRGITLPPAVTESQLRSLLVRSDGLRGWLARKRRAVVGTILGKLLDDDTSNREYQFLPDSAADDSLRRQIEQQGVVGGIASKLRGAADSYIDHKLDDIERRIDAKLDDIDRRLAEWRNQEIANRLKIIKITLAGTIIVVVISLIYSYVRNFF